jgi:FkbM family methyltransferase
MIDGSLHREAARRLYWGARQLLGLPPKTGYEVMRRFASHAQRLGWDSPGTFCFPWGDFIYYSAGKVVLQYEEIFQKRHYAFSANAPVATIVDCGGNIGLSAIWFKQNYPSCQLSVFEPDPQLYEMLGRNIASAGFSDVACIQAAVWVQNGVVPFDIRGDDRGRIAGDASGAVPAVDLAAWLPESTDLLKLDIEGAECEVLEHLCRTGAIRRVRNLVCELHILRGTEIRMISLLRTLIDEGLHVSLNYGAAVPGLGLAEERAPFEVIGRNHFLIELYAWWPPRTSASA